MPITRSHPGTFTVDDLTKPRPGLLSTIFAASEGGPRRSRQSPPQGPGGPNGNGDKKPGAPVPPGRGLFGILSFAIVCVLLFMMINAPGRGDKITLQELEARITAKQIIPESVKIRDDMIEARQKGNGVDSSSETTVYVPLNARAGDTVIAQVM